MRSPRRKQLEQVVEWDEYLQGYDARGRLILCICGEFRPNADWGDHYCPFDEQPEDHGWPL